MSDSAQVTSPGAINSMIAAISSRPTRENRNTLSRMLVLISAYATPAVYETVHMRCAPMRLMYSSQSGRGIRRIGILGNVWYLTRRFRIADRSCRVFQHRATHGHFRSWLLLVLYLRKRTWHATSHGRIR